jgi:hypothetical protein
MRMQQRPPARPRFRRALFPISLDSKSFRTSAVVPALKPICEDYKEVLFLVADSLQVYNKACLVGVFENLGSVLQEFEKLRNGYLAQRSKWLARLQKMADPAGTVKWRVVSFYDFMDKEFCAVYRRVLLAFHTLDPLRRDIEETASEHRKKRHSFGKPEMEQRLSEAYVLEEIALNIRVRVLESVESEFYVGEYLPPLLSLYKGSYDIDVFTIAGVPIRETQFRFFSLVEKTDRSSWELLLP